MMLSAPSFQTHIYYEARRSSCTESYDTNIIFVSEDRQCSRVQLWRLHCVRRMTSLIDSVELPSISQRQQRRHRKTILVEKLLVGSLYRYLSYLFIMLWH